MPSFGLRNIAQAASKCAEAEEEEQSGCQRKKAWRINTPLQKSTDKRGLILGEN